jgi:hypothetical protein
MFSVVHRFVESSGSGHVIILKPLRIGGVGFETLDKIRPFVEGARFKEPKPAEEALLQLRINA